LPGAYWRARGATTGPGCRFGADCQIGPGPFARGYSGLNIGHRCHLDTGSILHAYGGSISLGHCVYIGPYSVIYGHGGVEIGDGTLVAMGCAIISFNHTITGRGELILSQPDVPKKTTIGSDCWIGAGVHVLAGVTIGNGCVIGAGAVVTKDIPEYSIAAGNPARVMRERV